MSIDDIIDHVVALGGVLVLRPQPGDGSPPVSWGDVFFYYAPDGRVPPGQPFATIVTKDYPGEPASGLDRPGVFRLNIVASVADFDDVTARASAQAAGYGRDVSTPDVWFPHPVYSGARWVSVINPAERTTKTARGLLEAAHQAARVRFQRRAARQPVPRSRLK